MAQRIIAQGAEASIIQKGDTIIKSRLPKSYRHPLLDKQIRARRTRKEAKLLQKALAIGILVPHLLHTNETT